MHVSDSDFEFLLPHIQEVLWFYPSGSWFIKDGDVALESVVPQAKSLNRIETACGIDTNLRRIPVRYILGDHPPALVVEPGYCTRVLAIHLLGSTLISIEHDAAMWFACYTLTSSPDPVDRLTAAIVLAEWSSMYPEFGLSSQLERALSRFLPDISSDLAQPCLIQKFLLLRDSPQSTPLQTQRRALVSSVRSQITYDFGDLMSPIYELVLGIN